MRPVTMLFLMYAFMLSSSRARQGTGIEENKSWWSIPDQATFSSEPDSLKSNRQRIADSLRTKIDIQGELLVEGRYSEVNQPYQTLPQNYIRTTLNSTVTVSDIPVNFGLVYSTENNINHRINGFRIGFSNEALLNNLRKKALANANDNRFSSELDSLNRNYLTAQADLTFLDREFASPEYQNKLASSAELVSNYETDTLNINTPKGHRYRESKTFISQHRDKMNRFNDAKARIKQIEARQREIQLIKQNNINNLDNDTKLKGLSVQKLPLFYRLAMSVKTFEAGKFSPGYNSLLLDGVSLLGVNLELNPGVLYGSFSYGSLQYIYNAGRPGEYVSSSAFASPDARVYWVRAGIRNGKRFSVVINQMITNIGRKSPESVPNHYRNTVLGADILYFNKGHKVKLELAQSTYGVTETYGNTLKNINAGSQFNYAMKGQYDVLLNKVHQVDLSLRASYIAPDYFSICVPFIRKDNLKLAFTTRASLLKKIVRVEVGLRNEQDNFYKKSPISNNILVYTFSVGIRYKALPFIQLQASPGSNRMVNLADGKTYRQEFSLYSLTTGYSYQTKKNVYALNAFSCYSSYMQWFASDSVSYARNYQSGGSLMVSFKKPGVELNVSGSVATAAEKINQTLVDSRITKLLGQHSVGAGYTGATDYHQTKTDLYYLTLGSMLPFNTRVNIKGGYNQIRGRSFDPTIQDQGITININIIKKF